MSVTLCADKTVPLLSLVREFRLSLASVFGSHLWPRCLKSSSSSPGSRPTWFLFSRGHACSARPHPGEEQHSIYLSQSPVTMHTVCISHCYETGICTDYTRLDVDVQTKPTMHCFKHSMSSPLAWAKQSHCKLGYSTVFCAPVYDSLLTLESPESAYGKKHNHLPLTSGIWAPTSPLAFASSTMERNLSIWLAEGGVKSTILMWCSCSSGHESWYGGFRSHRQTRCLIPLSSRYWYSHVILGSANPASLPGSTQEKLCGGEEAMTVTLRRKRQSCIKIICIHHWSSIKNNIVIKACHESIC